MVFKKTLRPAPKNVNIICGIEIEVVLKQTIQGKVGQLALKPLLDPLTFQKTVDQRNTHHVHEPSIDKEEGAKQDY